MRILFWNIMHGGGRRAGQIVEQILEWNPDIVALAEFRGTPPSQFIAKCLFDAGYEHQLTTVNSDEPAWNAVYLASRCEMTRVRLAGAPEPELYWLLAELKTEPRIHIGVVHAPWSIYLGRLEYYAALVKVAENWSFGPGLIIGDTNTGITGLDEETEDSAEYHDSVTKPMNCAAWQDVFRRFHPDTNAPTWYSNSGNGRRLDQAFANAELQPQVKACDYHWGLKGDNGTPSDHAAILLDLWQLVHV